MTGYSRRTGVVNLLSPSPYRTRENYTTNGSWRLNDRRNGEYHTVQEFDGPSADSRSTKFCYLDNK